jgi:hypothetical protein
MSPRLTPNPTLDPLLVKETPYVGPQSLTPPPAVGPTIGQASKGQFNAMGANQDATMEWLKPTGMGALLGAGAQDMVEQNQAMATQMRQEKLAAQANEMQQQQYFKDLGYPLAPLATLNNPNNQAQFDYYKNIVSPKSGYAVAVAGGGYYVTNAGTTRVLTVTTASSTWTFQHNIGDQYPAFEIYDASNNVLIPSNIQAVDINTATITFAYPATGKAVATLGGGSGYGTVITTTSASSTWSLTHNLRENYPIVTIWESGSNQIVQPDTITSVDQNTVLVTFTTPVKGYANISRAGSVISGSTDWNLLMEVVGKIENYNEYTSVLFFPQGCAIVCFIENGFSFSNDCDTKIEAVYNACVEFIKWCYKSKTCYSIHKK